MSDGARFSVLWFSGAVVLTTATQLRIPGLPIGLGEVMLVAWLLFTWCVVLSRPVLRLNTGAIPILLFWVPAVLLLLAGWIVKLLLQLPQHSSDMRTAVALGFAAASISTFLLQSRLEARSLLGAKCMVVLPVVSLSLLMIGSLVGLSFGPMQVWYHGVRFRGWAENPNQIGLLIAPIPFIALFLFSRSTEGKRRFVWAGLAAASTVIGVASLSDSLVLAWAVGIVALVYLLWYRYAFAPGRGYLGMSLAFIVLPLMLLGAGVPLLLQKYEVARAAFQQFYLSGGGPLRLAILENAVEAMGSSPLVGLGPGAHSGAERPFAGYESHNTFLEWGTNTGLLGLIAFIGLIGGVWARAWRAHDRQLVLGLIALIVFSLFHVVLRQPTFWYYLVILAFAGYEDS